MIEIHVREKKATKVYTKEKKRKRGERRKEQKVEEIKERKKIHNKRQTTK